LALTSQELFKKLIREGSLLKRVCKEAATNIYPVYHLNPASANMRELFNLKFIIFVQYFRT
ncbi:hypothetical protein BpHYR1_047800, partial [Brachionus plicatilis]